MREIETPSLASDAMTIDDFVEHMLRELAALTPASRGIDAPMFNDGIRDSAAQLCAHRAGRRMTGPVDGPVLRTDEEAVIAGHGGVPGALGRDWPDGARHYDADGSVMG